VGRCRHYGWRGGEPSGGRAVLLLLEPIECAGVEGNLAGGPGQIRCWVRLSQRVGPV
jgi:hypothetical protein